MSLPEGVAQIRNVEFHHSGQEGWSDYTDPRYSVAFLNLGQVLTPPPNPQTLNLTP